MTSSMIIGSGFSEKNQHFLEQVASISDNNTKREISVKEINKNLALDRTEIKNMLEYLDDLGYLEIKTIGGPLLYGHICITQEGLDKVSEANS